MLFYANSLIVIEFCHDSIKKINFLYFRCSKNWLFDFYLYLCPREQKNTIMNPTIDTYRLTSMEEPSDAVLSQLMKEAAEEAKRTNEEATTRFFEQMREDAQKISATW